MGTESSAEVIGKLAHQVDFSVTLSSDKYGFDGSNDKAVSMFATRLSKFLDHSMHAGLFYSKMMTRAVSEGSTSLQAAKRVKLLKEMKVVHMSGLSSVPSVFADVVVVAGVFSGLLVGLMVVLNLITRRYSKKNNNSNVETTLQTMPTTLRRASLHESMNVVPAESISVSL